HQMIDRFPCNWRVLEHADGIIVHSQNTRRLAAQWYGCAEEYWTCIPHLRRLPVGSDRTAARRALTLGAEDFVVCCFGFLDPAKLSRRLLDAWLRSSLSRDPRFQLVFVGENHGGDYGEDLLATLRQSASRDRIRITGYVSDAADLDYLARAAAAVHLRGVTRGESSLAVLDCLAYGLPLVVNASSAFADVPDDALIRLPEQFTDAELTDALERIGSDAALRSRLATAGRNLIATRHDP